MNPFFKSAFLGMLSSSVYALSAENFPDNFAIKEFPCTTQCFELKNTLNEAPIGSLIPDTEHKGTYFFKDELDQTQITIQYAGNYAEALTFNAYDNQGRFLTGFLTESNPVTGGSLLRVTSYELDYLTIKSQIYSDPLGISHGVYKGGYWYGKQKLAHFTRPLFSWKTDSLVKIVDREQLFTSLDPNLFAALSAFDCLNKVTFEIDPQLPKLQTKVKNIAKAYPGKKKSVDLEKLNAISDLLNKRFQEQYQDVVLSTAEKIQKFVVFDCELVQYLKKYMNV